MFEIADHWYALVHRYEAVSVIYSLDRPERVNDCHKGPAMPCVALINNDMTQALFIPYPSPGPYNQLSVAILRYMKGQINNSITVVHFRRFVCLDQCPSHLS